MTAQHTSTNDLVERTLHDGFRDRAAAAHAVDATLRAFGVCLARDEARALAASLSHRLAGLVDVTDARADGDVEAFFARVSAREGVPLGLAREHASIVLRALSLGLDPPLRARLARALPEDLAALLSPRAPSAAHPAHAPARHAPPLTTLASGRPGSHHPVSESKVPAAQTHSVARAENPHDDSKLSSARGLTQEQLHASLATGGVRSGRPISEAKDEGTKGS